VAGAQHAIEIGAASPRLYLHAHLERRADSPKSPEGYGVDEAVFDPADGRA
jgi:hypothetical protein